MTPDSLADVIVATVKQAIAPLASHVRAIDERIVRVERSADELAAMRDRVLVLETRAPLPGPAGKDGAPGADGLGFDDLSVDFDGDRTLALKFTRGAVEKTFPIVLPMLRYQGIYQYGFAYVIGDVVTSGGAAWHCQQPTTLRPGDGVGAWRLMVKPGRDGKDANGGRHA